MSENRRTRTERIQIAAYPNEKELFERAAEANGMNLSEFIRTATRAYAEVVLDKVSTIERARDVMRERHAELQRASAE